MHFLGELYRLSPVYSAVSAMFYPCSATYKAAIGMDDKDSPRGKNYLSGW